MNNNSLQSASFPPSWREKGLLSGILQDPLKCFAPLTLSFLSSFHKCFMSTYYVPGTTLGTEGVTPEGWTGVVPAFVVFMTLPY